MKKLVMIAGPAGVGKTTVCQRLFQQIQGCAWLDGDWCWMVHPYPGKTEAQKKYVERSFGYILDGYLSDVNTGTVLFSWLMHNDAMFELVTNQLTYSDYELIRIVLLCDENEYIRRMQNDNRREESISNHDPMNPYRKMNAIQIDTTGMTADDVAKGILSILR